MTASPSTNTSGGMYRLKSRIVDHAEMMPGIYRLAVEAPEMARAGMPGQFVHVLCGDSYDPLLRRPFSLLDADPGSGTISLLYEVRGRGTAMLTKKAVGDTLDIIGPLGRGFTLPETAGRPAVIVAGGVGVVPICFLARRLMSIGAGEGLTFMIGARTASALICVGMLARVGMDVRTATDDGSTGHRGFVTDLLEHHLQTIDRGNLPIVYACGPMSMLKKVAGITAMHRLKCQVSTEAKMACGVGACMSCVIRVRDDDSFKYARACKEGPVFDADEIAWD